jgi:hypothetical protein
MLHPELQRLADRYRSVFAAVDAGQMEVDAALADVAATVAADAAGAVWSVHPDSDPAHPLFLRTEPGAVPVPADPAHYRPPGPWPGSTHPADTHGPVFDQPTPPPQPTTTVGPSPGPGRWAPDGSAVEESVWDRPDMATFGAPTGTTFDTGVPAGGVFDPPLSPTEPFEDVEATGGRFRPRLPALGGGAVTDRLGAAVSAVERAVRARPVLVVFVAAVAVVAAVALRSVGGDAPAPLPAGSDGAVRTYVCPELRVPVGGLPDEETATLLACLDEAGDRPLADHPYVASAVVTKEGDTVTFDPARPVSREVGLFALWRLWTVFGGEPLPTAVAVDQTGVDPRYAEGVQFGVNLGLVDPAHHAAGDQLSQADLSLWSSTVFSRLRQVEPPGPAGFADDATVGENYQRAAAHVRALGIRTTTPPEPFDYGAAIDAQRFVIQVGRLFHELADPGSVAAIALAGLPATPAPPTAPEGGPPQDQGGSDVPTQPLPDVPSAEALAAVVAELVSADRARAAAVVADPGDRVEVALRTAQFAGFAATGLTVTVADAPAPVPGGASVRLGVVDQASGATVATAELTLVPAGDGRWVVASWPTFEPVR